MSEPKKPELPAAPSFFQDPFAQQNTERLTELGRGLTSGEFREGGSLGFLSDLVTLNPEATQQAVALASRGTEQVRDRAQQDIINQLEANNQLTSSTAVNRLSDLNQEFGQDIADINTRFFLADVERSLTNTFNLFGLGLDATQSAGGLGLQNQAQRNQFNLANFDNQVAVAQNQQRSGRGGLFGGIAGTAIGGLVGGPFGAAIGGSLGSGIGEAVRPSSTGAVATSFGSAGLGSLGSLNQSDNQVNFLDRLFGNQRPGGAV